MKVIACLFVFFFMTTLYGQQTLGELYHNMSVLPWMNNLEFKNSPNANFTHLDQFDLELSREESPDLMLTIASDFNYMFNTSSINLSCLNGYNIHLDTAYVEHFQYTNYVDGILQVFDSTRTTTVVKKYHEQDSVFLNSTPTNQTGSICRVFIYNSTVQHVENVIPFFQDTSFVVLENAYGYITVLKIWQEHRTKLHILEARTNDPLKYFKEIFCFPNPSVNVVKFIGDFDQIQAHTIDGQLVLDMITCPPNPEISIENLSQGIYVFSCLTGNEWKHVKVEKSGL